MLWIALVLVLAIIVAGFMLGGAPQAPKKGCGSCPKAQKNPDSF